MDNETNKVHFDLTNVHVAPLTFEGGAHAFGAPKRLPGAISIDLAAQGNTVKLRADGIVYYSTTSNSGYEGDLNLAMVPDWFRQEYLGESLSEKDKVLVENVLADPAPFALLYEFLGDKKHRRHVLYSCTASRVSVKGENKENQKDPDTEALHLVSVPLPDGKVKASTTEATPDAVYNAWNTTVWVSDSAQ